MRRIILVVTVALVMAAMLVAALPALADQPPTTPGQFTCYTYNPYYQEVTNVPRGQVAIYNSAGYYCYRGQ
jgi:hypothetical protein